jgi:hypothetical protein
MRDDLVAGIEELTGRKVLLSSARTTSGPTPHWSRSCSHRARTVIAHGWLTEPTGSARLRGGRPEPGLGLTAGRRSVSFAVVDQVWAGVASVGASTVVDELPTMDVSGQWRPGADLGGLVES